MSKLTDVKLRIKSFITHMAHVDTCTHTDKQHTQMLLHYKHIWMHITTSGTSRMSQDSTGHTDVFFGGTIVSG